MRCDALYLSPHLDDAVLSCAARIRQETEEGQRVVVATLFTEGDTRQEALYQQRRAEDIRAVGSLGAAAVHCGLRDAPFRRPCYSSFRAIVLGSDPADDEDEAAVRRTLEDLLRSYVPAQVFCPLGVGTHIDHRHTYQAAVAVRGFERLIFYEDRPYVLVPGQLAMRLAELALQGGVPAETPAGFLQGFRVARYVQRYLHENEGAECEELLLRKLAVKPGAGRSVSPQVVTSSRPAEIVTAIALYATQLGDLYGNTQELCRESERYAADLGSSAYAERYWQG